MSQDATVRPFPALVPPDPPLDTPRVVARLDEATHGHSTFEVDYYEVCEKELVVRSLVFHRIIRTSDESKTGQFFTHRTWTGYWVLFSPESAP